jgi:hypothetical protein
MRNCRQAIDAKGEAQEIYSTGDLFVRRFIRQTGLGLWKRTFLSVEAEFALPLICNDLLAGCSLL